MGDQSLGLGEFQFERVAQELAEAGLDLLSFRAWPCEAEQEVVGIPHVTQASVIGVVGVVGRERSDLLPQSHGFLPLPNSPQLLDACVGARVCRIVLSLSFAGVCREKSRLDPLVQPVEVDVRQDGTHHTPLRRTAQGRSELPVLQIPRREQVLDEPDEPVVMDRLA